MRKQVSARERRRMLDFENGIRDLVKRVDNVTIRLAGLFCSLENELSELYRLSGGGVARTGQGLKKSEFIEGLKELLRESLINNQETSDDEYLIAMDNSVISLESLTFALVGTRSYVDCEIVEESRDEDVEKNLNEITENSSLIRLCRSVIRLTKHRMKIEKYDMDVNSELDNLKKEKVKELETMLRETESKLRSKEALCYAHEKQIEFLISDLEELKKTRRFAKGDDLEEKVCRHCRNPETALQSPRMAASSDCETKAGSAEHSEKKSPDAHFMVEPLGNFIEILNNQTELKDTAGSSQETFREENLVILELKDQIQILNLDNQLLREENSRLSLRLRDLAESSPGPSESGASQDKILFNILKETEAPEGPTETHPEETIVEKEKGTANFPTEIQASAELKVLKTVIVEIRTCMESTRPAPKPCLVMWEPIIECDPNYSGRNHNKNNFVPLSVSSFGEFRKSKNGRARAKPVSIVEGNPVPRTRITIDRNSFYCDLEKIIRKNSKQGGP
ncbi:hypothetical protein HWI79_2300 [Cryptosporidium felis]|nr:hypothetical protein HWI79_2300 [Cryptosporidium felis]